MNKLDRELELTTNWKQKNNHRKCVSYISEEKKVTSTGILFIFYDN
jgi:hypothetical protein